MQVHITSLQRGVRGLLHLHLAYLRICPNMHNKSQRLGGGAKRKQTPNFNPFSKKRCLQQGPKESFSSLPVKLQDFHHLTLAELLQMKGPSLEVLAAQLLISAVPMCSADKRAAAAPLPSVKRQQVFSFPFSIQYYRSPFTQGSDVPIFWGSNIMIALDINRLAIPLEVIFQNNLTGPF